MFRFVSPVRTYTIQHTRYRAYKPYLREDFNKRCGYCDDRDIICGGSRGFHIDHFRPRKLFRHLESDYGNLVYACPYCNGGKSDDWPSGTEVHSVLEDGRGYVDPCDGDLNEHFERHSDGKIRPKTSVGNYMFEKLKLGLRRHQLAWQYEQLEERLHQSICEVEDSLGNSNIDEQLINQHLAIAVQYSKYKSMFEETL